MDKYPPPDKHTGAPAPRSKVGPAPASAKTAAHSLLLPLAGDLSEERLRESITALSAFPTRHTLSLQLPQVVEWVRGRFAGLGYPDVRVFHYQHEGRALQEVVCVKPAAGPAAPGVIVTAHCDSRMENLADAAAPAPGANDNGSGVAVVLEMARVLFAAPLGNTVHFVITTGEEQGLWGSEAYAAAVAQQGLAIKAVLNIDEVGFPNAEREVIVEQDLGNVAATNDAASQALARAIAETAVHDLQVPTQLGPIYDSDYMPFEARGYVTIGLYESGKYPQYHTTEDKLAHVDLPYVVSVAKVALAAMLAAES